MTKMFYVLFYQVMVLNSLISVFSIYTVVRNNTKFSIKNVHLVMIMQAKVVLPVTN